MSNVAHPSAVPMSRRRVLESMSGLMVGMFVGTLSATVVATSLPRIVHDLHGDESTYTWVITATLLATTVSTPIWGKLADLMSRKLLVQLALVVFVVGSALAGLSQEPGELILFRVVQGLGAGGLQALVQVILSDILSPRDRGRYMGFLGATTAIGTAGGPLLGGFITDALGWRWNFYVGIPFAVLAIILIQVTLTLPKRRGPVRIDYAGAGLIAAGVSIILVWISVAGSQFAWTSIPSLLMVSGGLLLLLIAVIVELRVPEPIIPLSLFRNRTFTVVVVAATSVGVILFGNTLFLGQYMQLSRGKSATESGLLTLPVIFGLLLASTIVGGIISRTGHWKRWMVIGGSSLTVGVTLMSTVRVDTFIPVMFVYMFLMGAGIGMLLQNLVLVVQNTVDVSRTGAASSAVSFFRSLGGAIGVSALGAVLGSTVSTRIASGIAKLGVPASQTGGLSDGTIPELSLLPGPLRQIVESAYGQGIGGIYLIEIPFAVIVLIAVAFLPNIALGTKSGVQQLAEREAEILVDVSVDTVGGTPTVDDSPARPR